MIKLVAIILLWAILHLANVGTNYFNYAFLLAEVLGICGIALIAISTKQKKIIIPLFLSFWLFWTTVTHYFRGSLAGQIEEIKWSQLLQNLFSSWQLWTDLPMTTLLAIPASLILYGLTRKEGRQFFVLQIPIALIMILAAFVIPFISWEPSSSRGLKYIGLDKNRLYFGKPTAKLDIEVDLQNKNLILFILESVGSRNIDWNNLATQLPWIKSQAPSLHIWPDIVNTFPATTRSHIPLHSGGHTVTFGGPYEDLKNATLKDTLAQVFKKNQYETMVFSSTYWEFENLKSYYEKMEWDLMVDTTSIQRPQKTNSWGVHEMPLLDALIKKTTTTKRPYFAFFINNSTHHPYEVSQTRLLQNAKMRHAQSVNEAFEQIHGVIRYLEEKGKLQNTVVAIMGDHGEAFGEYHQHNLLHKNFLYQENIQNFLIMNIFDNSGKVTSHNTPIGIGDVTPLLLSHWKFKSNHVIRTNKLHFFHKNASPEQFGLRDGQWKFIGSRFNENENELYNLKLDPQEQNDIAHLYPERIKTYRQLSFEWLWETQRDFYLWTNQSDRRLLPLEYLGMSGLLLVEVVSKNHQDESHKLAVITGDQHFRVLLVVNTQENDRKATLRFISPDGTKYATHQIIKREWQRIWNTPHLPRPLIKGDWKIEVELDQQKKELNLTVR